MSHVAMSHVTNKAPKHVVMSLTDFRSQGSSGGGDAGRPGGGQGRVHATWLGLHGGINLGGGPGEEGHLYLLFQLL